MRREGGFSGVDGFGSRGDLGVWEPCWVEGASVDIESCESEVVKPSSSFRAVWMLAGD